MSLMENKKYQLCLIQLSKNWMKNYYLSTICTELLCIYLFFIFCSGNSWRNTYTVFQKRSYRKHCHTVLLIDTLNYLAPLGLDTKILTTEWSTSMITYMKWNRFHRFSVSVNALNVSFSSLLYYYTRVSFNRKEH